MADEDRLSQLPESILEKIFFLLPWDDAARMSVVAKTWRDMWATCPVFDFNFYQNRTACFPEAKSKIEQETQEFLNSIDKALVDIRPGKAIIKKFRLCLYYADPEIASRIDGWIGLATENFVRELAIVIQHGTDTFRYSIPTTTLLAKPVKVLSLEGCKLEQPLFVDMGKYFYLREVSFVKVCFDVEALLGFINLCPALEDFSIMLCNGLESLFIPYLPKLERLTVAVCENAFSRVDINATNLQSFCYEALARSSIVDELDISIAAHTQLRDFIYYSTTVQMPRHVFCCVA